MLHGNKTYLLQDETGQIRNAHSISAGLDYPGVGPEHAYLRDSGRAQYVTVTDDEAVEALRLLTATEGIIPALESAHAIAHAIRMAPTLDRAARSSLVNLSGRGDKDMGTVATPPRGAAHVSRIAEVLAARRGARTRRRSFPFLTAGDPVARRSRRALRARRRRRGRRPDRARRAVLRPDGRRPGAAARRRRARSPAGRRCRACSRWSRSSRRDLATPDRALRLLQPVLPLRRRARSRATPRRPASTGCCASTCRPRRRASCARRCGRRGST